MKKNREALHHFLTEKIVKFTIFKLGKVFQETNTSLNSLL